MSHELRTPLSVIMGYTDLMSEGVFGALAREQADILKRVKRNVRELSQLIAAMLDLSRLEAGRLPVDVQMVSIVDLIAEVQASCERLQTQSGLRFVWVVESQLAARDRHRSRKTQNHSQELSWGVRCVSPHKGASPSMRMQAGTVWRFA